VSAEHGGHRWRGGTHRAAGLAGGGRRYALIVAALVTLASLPTLAAITAGSATLRQGVPESREPFLVRGADRAIVIAARPPGGRLVANAPVPSAIPRRITTTRRAVATAASHPVARDFGGRADRRTPEARKVVRTPRRPTHRDCWRLHQSRHHRAGHVRWTRWRNSGRGPTWTAGPPPSTRG
jgi:hypothetical protein